MSTSDTPANANADRDLQAAMVRLVPYHDIITTITETINMANDAHTLRQQLVVARQALHMAAALQPEEDALALRTLQQLRVAFPQCELTGDATQAAASFLPELWTASLEMGRGLRALWAVFGATSYTWDQLLMQLAAETATPSSPTPPAPPTLDALMAAHGGRWGTHPVHSYMEWQREVADDETRHGYWAWVADKLAGTED